MSTSTILLLSSDPAPAAATNPASGSTAATSGTTGAASIILSLIHI